MLAAAADGSFADPVGLDDVNFDRALWADQPIVVRTSYDSSSRRLAIASRPVGESELAWQVYSRGIRRVLDPTTPALPASCHVVPPDAIEEAPDALYARFDRGGHHYGPMFRSIRRMWVKGEDVWAEVALDPALHEEAGRYYLHPALFDGAFQSVLRATPIDEEREAMFVPLRVERLEARTAPTVVPVGTAVICHVRNVHIQDVRWFADIDVFTPDGERVASLSGCSCAKKPQEANVVRGQTKVCREEWKPVPRVEAEPANRPAAWLVVDPAGTAAELARLLRATGAWVGHQHMPELDLTAEFLTRAAGNGVVVVWAAAPAAKATPSVGAIADAIDPLLKVGQSIGAANAPGVTIWYVGAGATWGHADAAGGPDLVQAPAAGVLRTIATELPKATCRLLDLDPTAPGEHVELALAEFWSVSAEDEIAYRNGVRFVNQLAPANPDALPWRPLPQAQAASAAYELRTTEPGSLDGLAWVETEIQPPAAHEKESGGGLQERCLRLPT